MYANRENELLGDGEKPGRGEAHLGPCQLGHKQLQLGTTEKENMWSNWVMGLSIWFLEIPVLFNIQIKVGNWLPYDTIGGEKLLLCKIV